METLRTFHNYIYITYTTMCNVTNAWDSYSSLVLGEPIDSLQNGFNLVAPQELVGGLLCDILSHGQRICDDAHTT